MPFCLKFYLLPSTSPSPQTSHLHKKNHILRHFSPQYAAQTGCRCRFRGVWRTGKWRFSAQSCLLAGFQGIFQKVGKDEAKIDLVDHEPGRQIDLCPEGNIFPSGQGGVVAEYAVHGLIFTEMQIRVWDLCSLPSFLCEQIKIDIGCADAL